MKVQNARRDAARVILADDHDGVHSGIRGALEPCVDIAVVAEAADGRELLELAGSTRPDVALIDISLPGVAGLEATRRLDVRNIAGLVQQAVRMGCSRCG